MTEAWLAGRNIDGSLVIRQKYSQELGYQVAMLSDQVEIFKELSYQVMKWTEQKSSFRVEMLKGTRLSGRNIILEISFQEGILLG